MKIRILSSALLMVSLAGLVLATPNEGTGRVADQASPPANASGNIDFNRVLDDLCSGENLEQVYVSIDAAVFEHVEFGLIVFKVVPVDNTVPIDLEVDGVEPYACGLSNLPLLTMGEIAFQPPVFMAWCGWVGPDYIAWAHAL